MRLFSRLSHPVVILALLCAACAESAEQQEPITLTLPDMTPAGTDMSASMQEDMRAEDMSAEDMSAEDMSAEDMRAEDMAMCGPQRCRNIQWDEAPALPAGRDHHMTFLHEDAQGAMLFVAGGILEGQPIAFTDAVLGAQIMPDGSLGPWQPQPAYPLTVAGAPVIRHGQDVFILGGRTARDGSPGSLLSIGHTTLTSEGSGEWESVGDMPAARFHHAGVSHGSFVYVTGGLDGNDASDSVWLAPLTGDAQAPLGPWREGTPLPQARTHHSSFAHQGHVYVLGGFGGGLAAPIQQKSVLRARIMEDGELGSWEPHGELPYTLATHANTVYEGHVYVFGGIAPLVGFSTAVLRAPLGAQGIGPWERLSLASLPRPTGHTHHVPVYRDRFYMVSGGERTTLTPRVHVGEVVEE